MTREAVDKCVYAYLDKMWAARGSQNKFKVTIDILIEKH